MSLGAWTIAVILAGVAAIIYGAVQTRSIMAASAGNDKMKEIASAIQEGADAYLKRQYTTIAIVGVIIAVVLAIFFQNIWVVLGFLIGAILSGAAGFIGMKVSVQANVRTTEASSKSLDAGLSMAFKSGSITGMLVVGLALIGVAGYYAILQAVTTEERVVIDSLCPTRAS